MSRRLNRYLDVLLNTRPTGDLLEPEQLADLRRSGLSDETIARQVIRSVPRRMVPRLLGFDPQEVTSAYVLPFPDPRGGWMNHVRLKVFPSFVDRRDRTVKYLGPRGAPPRVFFPLATLGAVIVGDAALWVVEGVKKALAVAQLGLPAVGFEGIEGWHVGGSRDLLPDFAVVPLRGRVVELVPDGDVRTNPNVERGALRFAEALQARGGRVRIVILPTAIPRGRASA